MGPIKINRMYSLVIFVIYFFFNIAFGEIKMNSIVAFDVDGTITSENIDLFMASNRAIASDKLVFDRTIEMWNAAKATDPYAVTFTMIEQVLADLPVGINGKEFEKCVYDISIKMIEDGGVRPKAIDAIRKAHKQGKKVAFCTTNFEDGVKGFLRALRAKKILEEEIANDIILTGTKIDWDRKKITFLNMDKGKVESLAEHFEFPVENIGKYLYKSYGDDPLGNDRSLLLNAKNARIINTKKNSHLHLNIPRLDW